MHLVEREWLYYTIPIHWTLACDLYISATCDADVAISGFLSSRSRWNRGNRRAIPFEESTCIFFPKQIRKWFNQAPIFIEMNDYHTHPMYKTLFIPVQQLLCEWEKWKGLQQEPPKLVPVRTRHHTSRNLEQNNRVWVGQWHRVSWNPSTISKRHLRSPYQSTEIS